MQSVPIPLSSPPELEHLSAFSPYTTSHNRNRTDTTEDLEETYPQKNVHAPSSAVISLSIGAAQVYALQVPYSIPFELVLVLVHTANVWVPETRVLCEHSAAWMSLEDFDAEHAGLAGALSLVLDVQGSRVADTVTAEAARRAMMLGKCIGNGDVYVYVVSESVCAVDSV